MKGSRPEMPSAAHVLVPEAQTRLAAFKAYTVTHPLLEKTGTALIQALREPAGFAHVLLYGPTGVGKTTVLTHVTTHLSPFFLSQGTLVQGATPALGVRVPYPLEARAPSPLLLLEARIPDGGTFNRADYYRTALGKLGEPFYGEYRLVDIHEGQTWETKTRTRGRAAQFSDSGLLRHALEDAVARHGVRAIIIDEAQHLMKVAGGAKLLDQLEWLKSMNNTMGVVHVLVGTYDLLDLRNLSSQAARRGHDIHFPRYQFQQEADQIAFQRTLRGLLEHVPLQMDLQDLMNHWYYFYERSIGCIGVLKDWLVRTLSDTLHSGTDRLELDRVRAHALSNAQCERMATDAAAAEHRLHYTESSREHLWSLLGMSVLPANQRDLSAPDQRNSAPGSLPGGEVPAPYPQPANLRVGQRAPERDPVGTSVQTEKPKKCSFAGEVSLSLAQLQRTGISKLQCPECGAMWTARIRGTTVIFPPHPPRTTKVGQSISRWIKQGGVWELSEHKG
jgi:AAA domain